MTQPHHIAAESSDADHPLHTALELAQIDSIDAHIITLLERDGRMSYADISAQVGLTAGGARARVKRLQERGIIRVIGVTHTHAIGLHSIASLQIGVDGDIDLVADRIAAIDGVRYLVLGTGSFNILVEAYAATPSALFTLIHRQIRQVPGVARIDTFMYESVHTHHPVFPVAHATA